ncbi:uncharacterized protein [Typha latifolia]|uniref:uncharacterized protein n=1 Tax=Typha latifolia TaxID=4733 RepID=UPI003C2AD93A
MRLPDDAEVSNEVWDEVIDSMKVRVGDKIPAIRAFAVRALSRFANDGEDGDIVDIFLQTLAQEQNTEARKAIVLSLPPSNATLEAIIGSTLDVSESVRKAAYYVLATKFPLQSLSIKHRTTLLQRGLSDRSPSVTKECLKMLKDEWLSKCCGGDPIALLRFLDVETYESVGEAVMEALLKDGMVRVQERQRIRQYLDSHNENEGECTSDDQLMDAEIALYWKTLCKHLQAEAQAKGSEAATTTGAEAAVYASEASDNNDTLEEILPRTISDYVSLVKAHLSAGSNYRFISRQLLLLGAMLDFSDTMNRKVAGAFAHDLLLRPLEYEVDDDGNKLAIGDGVSLGGDTSWARAVSELARKVHASVGEFEEVVTSVVEELARPCRDRTADFMQWMHCLAVTGFLLENVDSIWSLKGKAVEPSELLHSLLLPAAKHVYADVQRVAARCLCLFGLLERTPSAELVNQLRLSFINGPSPVSSMACKGLIDLATRHTPQEVDKAIGIDLPHSCDQQKHFNSVNLSELKDDVTTGLLDLLYSRLDKDDWEVSVEGDDHDNHDNVIAILGEGFAKFLLLSENYPSISADLHPMILSRLISLYFSDETKDLRRLKQCLSAFFDHYPALSCNHKRCVSRAFIPVMRHMWPGISGNFRGSTIVVSKMRKRAVQAGRFMLQMIQAPLFSQESEEHSQRSSDDLLNSMQPEYFDSGEEGLAIRIAAEVASCPEKKTPAGKAYVLALCRIAVMLQFRHSEQRAIKCMRGLFNPMISSVSADKELVKELTRMATRLKSLDEQPDEELSQDKIDAILGKLGWNENFKLDTKTVLPPTPAPRSARTAPARRRARREAASSSSDGDDEEDDASIPEVPMTPSLAITRSQRASKTVAMSRMTTKASESEEDNQSGVTLEESSDESGDDFQ